MEMIHDTSVRQIVETELERLETYTPLAHWQQSQLRRALDPDRECQFYFSVSVIRFVSDEFSGFFMVKATALEDALNEMQYYCDIFTEAGIRDIWVASLFVMFPDSDSTHVVLGEHNTPQLKTLPI